MHVAKRTRFVVLFLLVFIPGLRLARTNWNSTAGIKNRQTATRAQFPLTFEVNRGQAAANAKFVARGGGYTLLLTDRGEPVLALDVKSQKAARSNAVREIRNSGATEHQESAVRAVVGLKFSSGNPMPRVQGEQLSAGRSNYLIGNDPRKWLIGVPHYAGVRYREVYPGVDVLYYAKDQQLEYDFIVHPGSNPDSIRMAVEGAHGIEHGRLGSLELQTAAGPISLHKAAAYQQGPNGEQEVACNYVLDNGEVRFALGDYDHSQELRIDPVLAYASRLDASIQALAVDPSGNAYIAGITASANFPTTAGVVQPSYGGGNYSDVLIAKLDPTGSTLLFATYLGGNDNEAANSIVVDSNGNVIVTGSTSSPNFPVHDAFQSTLLGAGDAFLSKLNGSGSQLLYSTYLGGAGTESAAGVALDGNGRALLTGSTNSSNFPTTPGAFQPVYGGGDDDAFIAKVDTTKSGAASMMFSTYLGGRSADSASAIAVGASGHVFVTGSTHSTNFPVANPLQSACASCAATVDFFHSDDAFVSQLNADGTALVYSTFLGGNRHEEGEAIALDSLDNAYVAGGTWSSDFPTTAGAFQTSIRQVGDGYAYGPADAFVTKLNAAGSAFLFSSFLGGGDLDDATGIAVDSSGNALLSGYSHSPDFPTVNPLQVRNGGIDCDDGWGGVRCSDVIVTQINPSGSKLLFSTYLGGVGVEDSANGIALDAAGNMYVAGTAGGSFPFTQGTLQMTGAGFAAKISPGDAPALAFDKQQVTFGSQPVGSTSAAAAVLVRNMGSATLNISSISINSDFAQTNNCSSVSPGGNCTIQLTFAPTTPGPHNGLLTVEDNALGSPHSVSLSGTGSPSTISLNATPTSATVSKGGTATFPLTVGQTGVLTSAITFSCSGLPAGWSCGFNPTTVPAGSGPTPVTLTVQTGNASALNVPAGPAGGTGMPMGVWLSALVLSMLGMCFGARWAKVANLRPLFALGLVAVLLLAAGCGSNSQPAPLQTVSFTVNAASGGTTTSMLFTVNVR